MAKQEKQKPLKPPKIIDITFPVGGLVRQAGFQSQAPYTTFFSQNVWPFDPFLNTGGADSASSTPGVGGRQRGGSRPGLIKGPLYAGGALGGGSQIQLLDLVATVTTGGATSNLLVAVCNGSLYYLSGGAMVKASGYTSFNTTGTTLMGSQVGLYYYVADYSSTALAGTDGQVYSGGSAVTFPTTGNQIHSANFGSFTIGLDVIFVAHSAAFIAAYPAKSVSLTTTSTGISGGVALFSGASCVPNMVGGTLTIPNVESVVVTGYANSGQLSISDPTLTVASGVACTLEYSYASEAAIFAIAAGSTSTLINLGANQLTPAQAVAISGDSGMTWQIGRMIQRFDPTGATPVGAIPVTYGIPPIGCTLCCNYRGRLFLGGPGEIWYASRVNDPTDWDYGATPGDVQRAVSSTTSTTGGLGGPITAMIPQSDQYLIISSMNSMWILNGDPAYGGQYQSLSRNIGCIQANAWTSMPDGSVMFMSKDGLYSLAAGQAYPVPVSREKLPADLVDIDTTSYTASLEYDTRHRGVHIYVTPNGSGSSGNHWFFDVADGTFWPIVFGANNLQPYDCVRWDSWQAGAQNLMLTTCSDGYIRQYSDTAYTDDGTQIVSKIAYGPIRLGGAGFEGVVQSIQADLDVNSGAVTCALYVDHTSQMVVNDVLNGSPWQTISWASGVNHSHYPRCRGAATAILITGTPPWAIEDIRLTIKRGGRLR